MNNRPSNPFLHNYEKLKATKQTLSFSAEKDFEQQKAEISKKLHELIGMPTPSKNCNAVITETRTDDARFDETRFLFESEPNFFIPAHLIYPKNVRGKIPLVICLQGHSSGMHVSLARERYPSKTPISVEGDRDFCIQAVAHGYAALALEQRGFGELNFKEDNSFCCHELSWQAALMGTTLLGQRILDISNAITATTSTFDFIDEKRIGVMGNSGGGTSSYYAACFDERIKVSMPSSAFCSIVESWGKIYHCDCGYVKGILNFFDMADASILIAPRYLILVNGIHDHLQPFESAKSEFSRVQTIFEKAGAKENCKFVVGAEGHRFYADLAWPVFNEFINK